jgi:hypothetical protein
VTETTDKAELYTRYPISSVVIYNGTTALHYLLGSLGIALAYPGWWGRALAGVYLAAAVVQMWLLMPLTVCPSCVYVRLEQALCISGLNVVTRRLGLEGEPAAFGDRARGAACHNTLYMGSLILPALAMLPGLALSFSWALVLVFGAVVGLLLYRFFVVFPKLACLHCRAKYVCPNAEPMGVREL